MKIALFACLQTFLQHNLYTYIIDCLLSINLGKGLLRFQTMFYFYESWKHQCSCHGLFLCGPTLLWSSL